MLRRIEFLLPPPTSKLLLNLSGPCFICEMELLTVYISQVVMRIE